MTAIIIAVIITIIAIIVHQAATRCGISDRPSSSDRIENLMHH
jgi:hypothetical protein